MDDWRSGTVKREGRREDGVSGMAPCAKGAVTHRPGDQRALAVQSRHAEISWEFELA
jgi:hypothetical protein